MTEQKIIPSLWFDKNAEEAMNFYTSLFENSKIESIMRYPEGATEGPMAGMAGKVLTGIFELAGQKFMCLDGGPIFKFTPAISFFVSCKTEEEADKLWNSLSEGGEVMMEYQEYPFAKKYGWCNDKFSLSWQVGVNDQNPQKITPSLMFTGDNNGKAEEAINFYTKLLPDSEVIMVSKYEKGEHDTQGNVKFSIFKLAGQNLSAMESSGPHKFTFNEAVSLLINCEDQAEVDSLWEKMSAVPESEQCGWVKDKYGVSWQIIPKKMGELLSDPDKEKSGRALHAMLQMKKINLKELEDAFNGK